MREKLYFARISAPRKHFSGALVPENYSTRVASNKAWRVSGGGLLFIDSPKTIVTDGRTDGRTDTTLKGSGLGVKPNGFPQELEAQRARTWGKHKTGRGDGFAAPR